MDSLEALLFYFFSFSAVLSAIIVITNRRPTYGVLALAVVMLAISALFVLLKAYFVAVIQVLIYAGAILVLFLFVIMLLGVGNEDQARETSKLSRIIRLLLPLVLLSELAILIFAFGVPPFAHKDVVGSVEAIGEALFSHYLLPFELISGILLIGIFGVVSLAHKELQKRT